MQPPTRSSAIRLVKHLQAVLIAIGSSLVASALILQRYQAIAIGIPLIMFLVFFVGLHLAARRALPKRPRLATKFVGAQWLGLVGLAVLAGGVPLWLAALLPKDVGGAAQAGMVVVAVVVGLALIEVLKKLAVDEAIIESAGEREWKKLFTDAYAPLFDSGELPASAQFRTPVPAPGSSQRVTHGRRSMLRRCTAGSVAKAGSIAPTTSRRLSLLQALTQASRDIDVSGHRRYRTCGPCRAIRGFWVGGVVVPASCETTGVPQADPSMG